MKRALSFAGISVLFSLVACSGSVTVVGNGGDNGTDGGGIGSSSGSGSGGPGAGPCPTTQPSAGSACSSSDLACEYGGFGPYNMLNGMQHPYDVQGCDTVATCTPAPGGGALVWSLQGPTMNVCFAISPACPSTYASVPRGSACTTSGTICDYFEEGRCECTQPGGPACAGTQCTYWFCQDPKTSGCPTSRPALGSVCNVAAGVTCDYGSCTIQGGTAESCTKGVWTQAIIPCPI
jgi:hypothetical protein